MAKGETKAGEERKAQEPEAKSQTSSAPRTPMHIGGPPPGTPVLYRDPARGDRAAIVAAVDPDTGDVLLVASLTLLKPSDLGPVHVRTAKAGEWREV